jgi:hypothetical protein
MLNLSTLAANAAGNALLGLINTGSLNANGYLEIRTGTKPVSVQTAATGVVLATLPFSNPAFSTFTNSKATANTIGNATHIPTSNVAGWFRIYNRDGAAILDGDITIIGGGGDIEFDDINFIQGGTISIALLTATVK